MKKSKKITWVAVAFLLVLLSAVAIYQVTQTFVPTEKKLLYPLYSSLCCEAKGGEERFADKEVVMTTTKEGISCPDSTKCKISQEPRTPTCGLFSTPNWRITINGVRYCKTRTSPLIDSNYCDATGVPNIEFKEATFEVGCTPSGLPNSFKVGKTSSYLRYAEMEVLIYNYQALESKTSITGTERCQFNKEILNKLSDLPQNAYSSTYTQAVSTFNQLLGKNVDPKKYPELKEEIDSMHLPYGECRQYLDKWIDLPITYNTIQYDNQEVMCSLTKGVFKLEKLQTESGSEYLVPTSRLDVPVECCDTSYCRTKYNSDKYACNNFKCEKAEAKCVSDIQCQPEGGVNQDKNCYFDSAKNSFFEWSSGCDNGVCTTGKRTDVKCCDSYCSTKGLVCKKDTGCVEPYTPKEPCPPNQCCFEGNRFNYYENECDSGLTCCDESLGVGTCKASCTKPAVEDCEDKADNDGDGKIDCEDSDCFEKSYCKSVKCKWYDIKCQLAQKFGNFFQTAKMIILGVIGLVLYLFTSGLLNSANERMSWGTSKTTLTIFSVIITGLIVLFLWIYFANIVWLLIGISVVYFFLGLRINKVVKRIRGG